MTLYGGLLIEHQFQLLKAAVRDSLVGQAEYFYFSGMNSLPERKVQFVKFRFFFIVKLQNFVHAHHICN